MRNRGRVGCSRTVIPIATCGFVVHRGGCHGRRLEKAYGDGEDALRDVLLAF